MTGGTAGRGDSGRPSAWLTIKEASRLTGFSQSTLWNASSDGRIRRTTEPRRIPAFRNASKIVLMTLLYVPDLLAFQPHSQQKVQEWSGRPTEETLNRLMEAIHAVGRGDNWPIRRGENVSRYSQPRR